MRLILRPGSRPFVATARNAPTTHDASREDWRSGRRPSPPTPLPKARRKTGVLLHALCGEGSAPFSPREKVVGVADRMRVQSRLQRAPFSPRPFLIAWRRAAVG